MFSEETTIVRVTPRLKGGVGRRYTTLIVLINRGVKRGRDGHSRPELFLVLKVGVVLRYSVTFETKVVPPQSSLVVRRFKSVGGRCYSVSFHYF